MKTIDEREMQNKTKQREKRTRGIEAKLKAWELNGFAVHLS